MKITSEHQKYIGDAMANLLTSMAKSRDTTPQRVLADHIAHVKREGKYQILDKRIRWDIFSAAGLVAWTCKTIYPYADDSHLDTVLRKIMGRLNTL